MATIYEQGSGFPNVGAYVSSLNGKLYRVTKLYAQTGRGPGVSHWVLADVVPAQETDCPVGDEFPAYVVP